MLPTPPGSSLCGHTVSSGLSAVSLLACGVSVCCLLLSLSLLSPYVTCLSSDLWEAEFYTTCIIRGPLCQITGFSSLEYTSNTGKIPTDHDFSADRSIVGVSWKTNRLLYICLDPVCQLINPLSFSTLRKQCSGLDSPYSFKQAFLYLVYSPHLA